MIKLEILNCSACSALLLPKAQKCNYCGCSEIIVSFKSIYTLNDTLSKVYLNYTQQSNDTFKSALLHINLKNYEIASRLLEKEFEKNVFNSEAYYYYAFCIIGDKNISSLTLSKAREALKYLITANDLLEKGKYLLFIALIKYYFYFYNGLIEPVPNYFNHIQRAILLGISNDELNELSFKIVIPKNEYFNNLNQMN